MGVIIFLEVVIVLLAALLVVRSIHHDKRIDKLEKIIVGILHLNQKDEFVEVEDEGNESGT